MNITSSVIKQIEESSKNGRKLAFAYDRISDEAQSDGISLEYQSEGAGKYAVENDLNIIHKFEVIESASKEGRKVFNQMIDLALSLGIKNIIFKNTDRMSRNYNDLVRIEKLIDKENFHIHFYQSSLIINENSSYNDRFLIGIQLAVAKHLSDKISQDIREHNLYKANHGIAPGPSPLGYLYDKNRRIHILDPDRESEIRYVFDTFDSSDYSLDNFVIHLNASAIKTRTGKSWRKGPLHYMLTNPFYHGEFFYKDKLWSGTHAVYYDKSRYERRLSRLGDNFQGKKKRAFELPLAGHLRCVCGRQLTGQRKKGRYTYYTHDCQQSGKKEALREEAAFAFLEKAVRDFRFSPSFAENLKARFQHVGQIRRRSIDAERKENDAQVVSLEDKKSRLYDLYADREIDRAMLQAKVVEIDEKLIQLAHSREAFRLDYNKLMERACDLVDAMRDMPAAFLASSDPGQKAEILGNLAERVTMSREKAMIHWKKPFSYLLRPVLLNLKRDYDLNAPDDPDSETATKTLDSKSGTSGKPKGPKKQNSRPRRQISANPEKREFQSVLICSLTMTKGELSQR